MFKVKKNSQNLAFLDTLGYLVPVGPIDSNELYQIQLTSFQGSGASSCKILNTYLISKHYSLGNVVFGHSCCSRTLRVMKLQAWSAAHVISNSLFVNTKDAVVCLHFIKDSELQWRLGISKKFCWLRLLLKTWYRVSQVSCNIKNQHISAFKSSNQFLKKDLERSRSALFVILNFYFQYWIVAGQKNIK